MKDKRAISTVFATMLLIILVLVAVLIIWALVRPALLRTGEETKLKTLCLSADVSIESALVKDTVEVEVRVARGSSDVNITGIQILVDGENQGIKTPAPTQNGVKLYTVTGESENLVQIAPQVRTDAGTEKLCEIKDERKVV